MSLPLLTLSWRQLHGHLTDFLPTFTAHAPLIYAPVNDSARTQTAHIDNQVAVARTEAEHGRGTKSQGDSQLDQLE